MVAVHHRADRRPPGTAGWLGTFVTGLLLWTASVIVTWLTGNLNMIPTIVLLGSFLVPATAVIWYLDHYHGDVVTPALAARAFIVGGVIGVLAASVLESLLSGRGLLLFFGVGLIEELAKLLGLLLLAARRLPRYAIRDGIVLGAAVGFGFAALESSGYALTSLFVREDRSIGLSLGSLVSTEVLRGILAPVGHGLWTAILGGALFAASRNGRLRISIGVLATYLLVAVLHALWNSMDLIATLLAALYLAIPTPDNIWLGIVLRPRTEAMLLDLGFYFAGLIVLSLIGIGLLRRRWVSESRPAAPEQHTPRAA